MFNFHKGTYVIKTLCKLVQKLTQIILPDADITIASLNSDLNVIWLLILLLLFILLCREANISNVREVRASMVIHIGQNTQGNALWGKKITKFARNHRHSIRTGLVFSEDH